MAFSGFWDEGVSLAKKGIALTAPTTPRWWWWASGKRHWAEGEYQAAFEAFRQGYVEQLWLSHLQIAYTLPFLDRVDEARAHVASLLKLESEDSRSARRTLIMRCGVSAPSYREKMRNASAHGWASRMRAWHVSRKLRCDFRHLML